MDEADPIAGQLLVTHLLYTVQDRILVQTKNHVPE